MNAVIATPFDLDIDDAEERLREWGWQCGAYRSDESSRRPYHDTKLKEIVEIGKAWKEKRDERRERKARRQAGARKAAETRRRMCENDFSVCGRCNLLHFRDECPRCAADPLYSALGKQTRDNQPNLDGPVLRITAESEQIDKIVGTLPADMRDVLRRCYTDGKTPWRKHAWELRISWREFEQLREAAIEAVAERLATRVDAAL